MFLFVKRLQPCAVATVQSRSHFFASCSHMLHTSINYR